MVEISKLQPGERRWLAKSGLGSALSTFGPAAFYRNLLVHLQTPRTAGPGMGCSWERSQERGRAPSFPLPHRQQPELPTLLGTEVVREREGGKQRHAGAGDRIEREADVGEEVTGGEHRRLRASPGGALAQGLGPGLAPVLPLCPPRFCFLWRLLRPLAVRAGIDCRSAWGCGRAAHAGPERAAQLSRAIAQCLEAVPKSPWASDAYL